MTSRVPGAIAIHPFLPARCRAHRKREVRGLPEGVPTLAPITSSPWAQACGGFALRVEDPRDLDAAVRSALDLDGPALLDVCTNADEPPMPAKIRYQDAKGFAQAFLHGQPRRAAITSTLFRDKVAQLTHRATS